MKTRTRSLRGFLVALLALCVSACSSDKSVAEPSTTRWPIEVTIPAETAELVLSVGRGQTVSWSRPTILVDFEQVGVSEDGSLYGDLRFDQYQVGGQEAEEMTEELAERFGRVPRVKQYHDNGLSWLASYRAWVDDQARLQDDLQRKVGVELRDRPFAEQKEVGIRVLEESGLIVIGSVTVLASRWAGDSDQESDSESSMCEGEDGDLLFSFQYDGWARGAIPVWTVSTPPPPTPISARHFTKMRAEGFVQTVQSWLNLKPAEGFVMRVEISSGGGAVYSHTRRGGAR